ncbi:hypothetical protein SH601_11610 [Gracilibacillus sp. S3-1-1]|uniref:Uncharacterized protein n=1 Tax=Gracilibacillus pellucidus TaxID=3095368 RepID=A0ACC6M736_9BACI|nr:hypothetical protein [Gracilibacillus sp. S3-1-1]MDX8046627.1 hypothetical protein [Gracilibacillus sp. S3-1-1]
MLGFQKYLYTVVAEVDGWTLDKTIESDVTLPKNEVAKRGFELFGINAKLIGYKMKTI